MSSNFADTSNQPLNDEDFFSLEREFIASETDDPHFVEKKVQAEVARRCAELAEPCHTGAGAARRIRQVFGVDSPADRETGKVEQAQNAVFGGTYQSFRYPEPPDRTLLMAGLSGCGKRQRIMRPSMVSLLMQAYFKPDTEFPYDADAADLLKVGMIYAVKGCLRTTAKANVWIERVLRTPLPEQCWRIPEAKP